MQNLIILHQSNFLLLLAEIQNLTCDFWQKEPLSRLALIILCDQFSRNIYRKTKKAFAYDSIALQNSKEGIEKEQDKNLTGFQKLFFYMPLMHSEAIDSRTFFKPIWKTSESS